MRSDEGRTWRLTLAPATAKKAMQIAGAHEARAKRGMRGDVCVFIDTLVELIGREANGYVEAADCRACGARRSVYRVSKLTGSFGPTPVIGS